MIETVGATLAYEDHGRTVFACEAVDLRVEEGEFLGILGPSGSGKSSLLYLLSGLKSPTSGRVEVDGRDVATMTDVERADLRLRRFGFVFQQAYLLGYLTALENVLIGIPDSRDVVQAQRLLDDMGIGAKSHRLPHELSGGERQRVCVARALFGDPRVIFADEPTAALDHRNGESVVGALNARRGAGALIMVTHDESMLAHADRIVRINDGRIVQTDSK